VTPTDPSTAELRSADVLRRFMLQGAPVRGELVSLDAAWREVTQRHDFPRSVRDRLGELCAAALLLSASLKFDGSLILQIHGDGPVALLVAECDQAGRFRATAKLRDGQHCPDDADLTALVNATGRGRCVVTLDPGSQSPNRQPYQGIVPFEGDSIATMLEQYMMRSEQVPTRLWLAADGSRATGLLLQRLPQEGGAPVTDADGWNRMQKLADTVTRDELLTLPPDSVTRRLFWQELLHSFDSRDARFACSCSRERVASMLRMLGEAEIQSIVAERGSVGVHCEYCNTAYDFDAVDGAALFVTEPTAPVSQARH
jgi:molecular chaperone Hsp33